MNDNIPKAKLAALNADYTKIKGQPFTHFFCPILFKDEDVPLCKAHIENQAFPEASQVWTVQRKDVDNFYGSIFESEFAAIQYRGETHEDILVDKKLSKLFKPQILVDDKPVDFYRSNNDVPKEFTKLQLDSNGKNIKLALKIPPEELEAVKDKKWEMSISKDVRVSALVSLIKAAYLTLFEMLGYQHTLSLDGYFVGRQILGEFFLQNYGKAKSVILENAHTFFQEFAHMARPLHSSEINFQGTITDNQLLLCQERGGIAWAVIVFVKTAHIVNAILLPLFDQTDSVAKFFDFLKNENETIEVALMRFEKEHFEITGSTKIIWPKTGVLYPD